jgi:hypothetical protein
MTTKKERAEALARMTKAELVKTIKALDARVTKLLNALNSSGRELETAKAKIKELETAGIEWYAAKMKDTVRSAEAVLTESSLQASYSRDFGVVGTVTGRLAPADRDVVKAALDGYDMQQADLRRDFGAVYDNTVQDTKFPWEQSFPNGFINPDDVPEE